MNAHLTQYKCIVTSGPTREWLDPVRYISNASTGSMGFHIAKTALKYFQNVVYVCGPVCEKYQHIEGAQSFQIETTQEMFDILEKQISSNCLLIQAAAPLDFKPKTFEKNKIKKKKHPTLLCEFERNIDILKELEQLSFKYENFLRIGFAAETENLREEALSKLHSKNLDLICANQVYKQDVGFGENKNSLLLISKNGLSKHFETLSKSELALELILFIINANWLNTQDAY